MKDNMVAPAPAANLVAKSSDVAHGVESIQSGGTMKLHYFYYLIFITCH